MMFRSRHGGRRGFLTVASLAAAGLVSGCAAPPRLAAVPREATGRATALGLANERFFYISDAAAIEREFMEAGRRQPRRAGLRPGDRLPTSHFLAVSGGGENGAFGAGLLNGWSEAGTRPVFDLVTGVSTGALTAPFAYLGPDYDPQLRGVYTDITLRDVAISRGLISGAFADGLADTRPLFDTISRYLDDAMLAAIAEAYRQGRLLLVGTTNLDAQTPVVWNIGAIAASGHPEALGLVRRILLASASIPGAFPPVLVEVRHQGRVFQEMHVDGGASMQVFLYPPTLNLRGEQRGQWAMRQRTAHVIRNGRVDVEASRTPRGVLSITRRSAATLLHYSGLGDISRIHLTTQRDGIGFRVAYIGREFDHPRREPFDPAYMQALFDYGFERGRLGDGWRSEPSTVGIMGTP